MSRKAKKTLKTMSDPEILLAFGWYDYHLHAGVVRYACEHGWNIRSEFAQQGHGVAEIARKCSARGVISVCKLTI